MRAPTTTGGGSCRCSRIDLDVETSTFIAHLERHPTASYTLSKSEPSTRDHNLTFDLSQKLSNCRRFTQTSSDVPKDDETPERSLRRWTA